MAKVELKSYLKSIHGRVGNQVYYNVKGKQYVRSYAVPRNPRTLEQQKNRRAFSEAVLEWQNFAPHTKDSYRDMARDKNLSGYNLFISLYMKGSLPELKTVRREENRREDAGMCFYRFESIPLKLRSNIVVKRRACFYPYMPPGRTYMAA